MIDLKCILTRMAKQCVISAQYVNTNKLEDLINSILKSDRIFIYGSGRSGLVGQMFAIRLVQLGFNVHFTSEMTTPVLRQNDLTILISNKGKTYSVIETAKTARRIGSRVISVTGSSNNDLAKISDVVIVLSYPSDSHDAILAPLGTIFEDSALLFFDCMVYCIMELNSITEQDMQSRHAAWV